MTEAHLGKMVTKTGFLGEWISDTGQSGPAIAIAQTRSKQICQKIDLRVSFV